MGTVLRNKTCSGLCTCKCGNSTTTTTTIPPAPTTIDKESHPSGDTTSTNATEVNKNYYIVGIFIGAAMCASFLFALLFYTKSVSLISEKEKEEKVVV
jgi:hypothetical protein